MASRFGGALQLLVAASLLPMPTGLETRKEDDVPGGDRFESAF
jgi:hypothetical protein